MRVGRIEREEEKEELESAHNGSINERGDQSIKGRPLVIADPNDKGKVEASNEAI